MPKDIQFTHLSWDDMEKNCLSICSQMSYNNYKPETIIGLLRGGIVPARIFSDFYNILLDFFALDVKLYNGVNSRNEVPSIKAFYGDVKGKNILVVDDIWDSGRTMSAVLDSLDCENVKTATLYWKETALDQPDYYGGVAKHNEWIVFPWERYEFWREMDEKAKS